MGKEINLIPKKNIGVLQQERTITILRAVAVFSVIVVSCTLIGVFFLGRTNSGDSIASEQDAMNAKLQTLKPKIQKEIALVNRTNQIQTILKNRSSIIAKATDVESLIPSAVSTNNLSLTSTDFTLGLSSQSLSALTSCMDNFTNALKKKTTFSTVTIDNVSVNTTSGIYTVNIKGTFL